MNFQTYTVFYCNKHSKSVIIENIHKNISNKLCVYDDCIESDWSNLGYITINKTNNIIIYDNTDPINFLKLSEECKFFSKNFEEMKVDQMNPLMKWLKCFSWEDETY